MTLKEYRNGGITDIEDIYEESTNAHNMGWLAIILAFIFMVIGFILDAIVFYFFSTFSFIALILLGVNKRYWDTKSCILLLQNDIKQLGGKTNDRRTNHKD